MQKMYSYCLHILFDLICIVCWRTAVTSKLFKCCVVVSRVEHFGAKQDKIVLGNSSANLCSV